MESNAFKTEGEPFLPGAVVLLGTLLLGLVAVVGAFALDPLGPSFVILTWSFSLGGLVLALASGRTRSCGVGLMVAGLALPLAGFAWLWVAVSCSALTGSVSWS